MPVVQPLVVESRAFAQSVTAQLYLPPDYDPAKRYPVLYCIFDTIFFGRVGFLQWLAQQAETGRPVVAVGIPVGPEDDDDRFYRLVAEEVLPAVEGLLGRSLSRTDRRLVGFSSGADSAVEVGLLYGHLFSRVFAQSPGWLKLTPERQQESLLPQFWGRFAQWAPTEAPELRILWGADSEDAWESRAREHGAEVLAFLQSRGVEVATGTVPGGHTLDTLLRGWAEAAEFLVG